MTDDRPPAPGSRGTAAQGNGRWALVADRNASSRGEIGRFLEGEGWQVTLCADGPSAIRNAVKREYDIVLVEFSIPGIRGCVVTEAIRMLNPRARIIGTGSSERRTEFLEAGADAFLLKPFDLEEMIGTGEGKDTGLIPPYPNG